MCCVHNTILEINRLFNTSKRPRNAPKCTVNRARDLSKATVQQTN